TLFEMDCAPAASSAGITVEIVGANLRGITDDSGHWVIGNVPAGYYTFHFSKPGCTEYYESGIQVVGGGTLYWNAFPGGYQSYNLYRLSDWHAKIGTPIVRKDTSESIIKYWILFPSISVLDSNGKTMTTFSVDY